MKGVRCALSPESFASVRSVVSLLVVVCSVPRGNMISSSCLGTSAGLGGLWSSPEVVNEMMVL